jgi:hypothetical protein
VPGLDHVVLADGLPAGARGRGTPYLLAEGQPLRADGFGLFCNTLKVSPGFFSALGMTIRRGHDFQDTGANGSTRSVILNESAAAAVFGREDPIGRRVTLAKDGPALEVVAVVADTDRSSSEPRAWRYAFVPFEQDSTGSKNNVIDHVGRTTVIARVGGQPVEYGDRLRAVVRAVDPDVALFDVGAAAQYVAVWRGRFAWRPSSCQRSAPSARRLRRWVSMAS